MKVTCFLLFLTVGGSLAARGLESHASGDATATAGRSLLAFGACTPLSSTRFGACKLGPLPSGLVCYGPVKCTGGYQESLATAPGSQSQITPTRRTQSCTVYQGCTYTNVAGGGSSDASSSQSGGISATTTQQSSTTGNGAASTSVSATGTLTINVDSTALVKTFNTVYQSQCGAGGLNTAVISDLLVTYVQSCANAYIDCETKSRSVGGGSTSATCNVEVNAAQEASALALVQAAQSFINSACSSASADVNQAYVYSYITSEFKAQVWTIVSTNGYGTAKAVAKGDVQSLLSAFTSLCFDLYAKTCPCKNTCGFCTPQPVPNCPGTGCPTTTNPSTGVSVDGNTGNVAIDYGYYKGVITSVFANGWATAYNKGCGQYATVGVWADAWAQAVARIMADFTLRVKTTGSGSATAGFNFDAIGSAVTDMLADFQATALVQGGKDGCAASAAASAVDVLRASGFADFVKNKCKEISASGYDYDAYHRTLTIDFTTTPAITDAYQKLDATVGSDCLCGVTPAQTIVASNTP